jgi:hypothetical protein
MEATLPQFLRSEACWISHQRRLAGHQVASKRTIDQFRKLDGDVDSFSSIIFHQLGEQRPGIAAL